VWSVTKSVVSILVGIAVDEGRLRLDQTLRELLPGETSSMTPQVEAVTLRQLLTMTAGVQKEGGRFLRISGKAGEFSVEAVDAVSQILTFGFTNDPGAIFEYSNGSAHLVSAVLREAIDEPILEYARERLFDPLGIKTRPAWQGSDTGPKGGFDQAGFAWATDRSGINLGALGLKLTASDLLKLGDLYINGGRWHGQQIVSAQWVQESTSPQLLEQQQLAGDPQYGYLWLPFEINGHRGFEGSGSYTQKIVGFPDLHAVVVVTAADDTLGEEDLNPVLGAVMDDVVFTPLTS
jgi:CubicO group peptidase (beta-lactamase class C family)